jgi:hypothetical protein
MRGMYTYMCASDRLCIRFLELISEDRFIRVTKWIVFYSWCKVWFFPSFISCTISLIIFNSIEFHKLSPYPSLALNVFFEIQQGSVSRFVIIRSGCVRLRCYAICDVGQSFWRRTRMGLLVLLVLKSGNKRIFCQRCWIWHWKIYKRFQSSTSNGPFLEPVKTVKGYTLNGLYRLEVKVEPS